LGVKLTAASPPLYCALSGQGAGHGRAEGGLAGCPISRQLAEKKAQACGGTTVVQAALARATWSNNPSIGRDHLVWAVVVKGGLPVIWSLPPGGRRLPPGSCQA